MSKKKVVALAGLAAVLSFLPIGCSPKNMSGEDNSRQEQQASKRRHGNRENISVSHIAASKDYVKSINLLLSLYSSVIPWVQKIIRKSI